MNKKKRNRLKDDGFGVIEVVLIIIVVIALVFIFQEEITNFLNGALEKLQPAADKILIETGL